MARIRTIKPEFWTDERLTECSMSARLLFIGMLNFADDNGNLVYSAKRLKMQIFPGDAVDVQPMLNELITHGVLIEYEIDSNKYIQIKGFKKHQLINRPSATSIPEMILPTSQAAHGVLTEPSLTEWKGEESKGVDIEEAKASLSPAKLTTPNCPTEKIIEIYHEVLPELPAVRLKTESRVRATKKLWQWVLTSKKPDGTRRAESLDDGVAWLRDYFILARNNDFLMGRQARSGPHENWQCDFDFLLTEKGLKQVIEKTRKPT